MAKNPKMVFCRNCNNQICETLKICPFCGAKQKRKSFCALFFIVLIIIFVLVVIIGSLMNGSLPSSVHDRKTQEPFSLDTQLTVISESVNAVGALIPTKEPAATRTKPSTLDPTDTVAPAIDAAANAVVGVVATAIGETFGEVTQEFKAAMDEYEAFFDEYVAFMNKYSESGNSLSLLADYTSFLSRFTDAMAALDKIGGEDLNTADLKYYTEAMLRINQKISTIKY